MLLLLFEKLIHCNDIRTDNVCRQYSNLSCPYRASSPDNYSSSMAYEDRLRNRLNTDSYRVSSRDLYSYKHYRKSNQVG